MKNIHILTYATATLLLTAAAACAPRTASDIEAAYSREVYTPAEARGFSIGAPAADSPEECSTLLSVGRAWQSADSAAPEARRHLLILRGGDSAPRDFDGQCLRDSARRIVAMSSSHVAMLEAIGATDKIVGVSGLDYISNASLQSRRGELADVGHEGNVDYEALVGAAPDLVLLYGINGASPMEGRLEQLGIPYLYVGDYVEQSPTGKAEWVVAMGEVTGRRGRAIEVFGGIKARYDSVAATVAGSGPRARVMLNTPYADSWFMPPAGSYAVRLIEDAGGEYVYAQNTSGASVPIDIEEAYALACGADIWLNTGTASTAAELLRQCPKFADVPAVRTGRVFNNTLRSNNSGGNDYWESGVMNPDLILSDLIRIVSLPPDSIGGMNYYLHVE